MKYKQSSIEIIGELIASLTFPVVIKTATNDGGGKHTLELDDMYHAQPGFSVTIGGKKYLIEQIIPGTDPACGVATLDVLKIKGDATSISATTFDMYPPFYFYGNPIAEGVELVKINQAKEKTPMFWLRLDDFSEKFFEDERIPKERELTIRLYPLSEADHERWETSEAKLKVVDPMRRLAERLINKIKSMPERFDKDNLEWDIPAVFPKFGVITINRGVEKSLWHDKLGGLEMEMTLTVYKREGC